jgi:trimeric autotransporter adhesin
LLVTMLTAPTSGTVGGSLAGLSVTIKNQGPASTGAFRVGFYFATSATYTASAVMSNSYCAASSGVAAGAAWTCSGAISIPASLSPGAYYLIAYVDDQSQVTESNEANNWLAATTGLIMLANGTGQPDLLVTALTAPTSGTVGGSLAGLSVTAKNQGTTAAGTHRIGFYFSTSATYTTSAVMSSSYCAASTGVAAGAAWTCSGAISIPAWLSPGGYYLIAYADDQSQVTESNETNNWLAATTGLITLH